MLAYFTNTSTKAAPCTCLSTRSKAPCLWSWYCMAPMRPASYTFGSVAVGVT